MALLEYEDGAGTLSGLGIDKDASERHITEIVGTFGSAITTARKPEAAE